MTTAIAEQMDNLRAALSSQIRAQQIAAANPVPETAALLALYIEKNSAVQDNGSIFAIDAEGLPRLSCAPGWPEMTIADLIAETRTTMPQMFLPAEATVAPVVSDASAAVSLAARIRASTAAHAAVQAATKAAPASTVNPLDPKTHNLTAQMLMLNTNPALADRMKAALLPAGKQ